MIPAIINLIFSLCAVLSCLYLYIHRRTVFLWKQSFLPKLMVFGVWMISLGQPFKIVYYFGAIFLGWNGATHGNLIRYSTPVISFGESLIIYSLALFSLKMVKHARENKYLRESLRQIGN